MYRFHQYRIARRIVCLFVSSSFVFVSLSFLTSSPASAQNPPPLRELNDDEDRALCATAMVILPANAGFASYNSLALSMAGDQLGLWKLTPWETLCGPEKAAARVATLISLGTNSEQPMFTTLGMLQAGQNNALNYWQIANINEVKTLDPLLLMRIRDRRPIPRLKDDDQLEQSAYLTMLRNAYQTSDDAFRLVARELDRTRALTDPSACRDKVFRISGQMRLLRRYNAPAASAKPWLSRTSTRVGSSIPS